jgi:hypothetical protein
MNSLADSHFSVDGKIFNRKTGLSFLHDIESENNSEDNSENNSEDNSEDEYVIISSNEGINGTTSVFGEAIAQAKYFVLSNYFAKC